ncbi:PREDICTED: asparagine synthetase domain-containing protein CG17486 [Polistes canadensis]|uniref:asparagine synthetase domain-containing protein CG17486 n=1 Tax=Polistes canadensis TaxID=91411 RepID=UPI000718B5C0|nr:PREDICTED: asparagine synthetase domain-containing protein CG17486 [Polistes canadensis]
MCGIFCCISQCSDANVNHSDQWDRCKNLLISRGPDKLVKNFISLTDIWCCHLAASILWTQGLKLAEQPLIDPNGNILLWNGDVFSGSLAQNDTSDSITVLNAFSKSLNITNTLRHIQGPYSFIYFQKSSKLLYFGRDIIGRHSLLLQLNNEKSTLTITSVGGKCFQNILEVPAIGIFVINLSDVKINLTCYPWKEPDVIFENVIEELKNALDININVKDTITEKKLSNKLITHLNPIGKDLDYLETYPCLKDFNNTIEHLLKNEIVSGRVEFLSKLLHEAVEVRVKTKPNFCKNCISIVLRGESIICNHGKVGILFSGGLDSAILTLIAHKYVPQNEPIDLINVAFEKTTIASQQDKHIKNTHLYVSQVYDVPDRKTGRQTLSEILQICPNRKWNFVEVNVTQAELTKYRSSRISDLLYPLCTILDESLGCAMWFASRAKGIVSNTDIGVYESPCRILLLGIGADELFGGYMRHRTILKHKGWNALKQELNDELAKISQRNLGRDDRIISDNGRQSRLPYLDENVIQYVQQLQPWERCFPTEKMPPGLGDKLLLRLLGRKLGLQNTATFPKRAFQFGSRIANGKENAKDISQRL